MTAVLHQEKKRITCTLREDLPSMDPQNSNSISIATAEICTHAMLTRNVEGEIKPDAAESWDISDDGLILHSTFVME